MNLRVLFIGVVCVGCAVGLGYWLLRVEPVVEVPAEASMYPAPGMYAGDVPVAAGESIAYPRGAMLGELVVYFKDRQSYDAYLAALLQAGLAPRGRIDELLTLRLDEAMIGQVSPAPYGADYGYNFYVQQPLPPVDLDPDALASLRGYDAFAAEITGELEGDGSGVLVAILDSGIAENPLFDDVYIVHVDLVGGGVDGPGAEHGSAVASIIAGDGGIAPNAELLVMRVLDDQGIGHSFHVAQGIIQAVDLGAEIVNLSLGMYQDTSLLRHAVQYAAQRGVALVASAGNDGYAELPYPAAYGEVLAVTAVDALGRQAVFPNQSDSIDFAAPGVGVITAFDEDSTQLFSGTSAAAPFVSGTLAAMVSAKPERSMADHLLILRQHLNEAGALGTDAVYGDGLLDWDRLRERTVPGRADIALADIHLGQDAVPGTTVAVEVVVQNRGTRWLASSHLEVIVDDADPVGFVVESLAPGKATARKVYVQVPGLTIDQSVRVMASVMTGESDPDVTLENNLKAIEFRPIAR